MLLLIATASVFVWFLFAHGFEFITTPSFENSKTAQILNIASKSKLKYYNLARPLEKRDLKGRVIILSFMDLECTKCVDNLDKINEIEDEFDNRVAIIGVYSTLEGEKNRDKALRKEILRNNIGFTVIDDKNSELKREFGVNNLPTYILLDSKGRVLESQSDVFAIDRVAKVIKKYIHNLNSDFMPIALESNAIVKNVLSFPSKIEYTKEIRHKYYKGEAFFVSNSGSSNIMVFKESGKVITQLGSKNSGYFNSNVKRSKFRSPMGMTFYKNKLYVADSLNNAIRKVDFAEDEVTTLVGDSKSGGVFSDKEVDALSVSLSYPTDVEFFPDRDNLIIANSGTNQLLRYNFKTKKVKVVAGSGELGVKDGKYPNNSLAMTSDMSVYDGKLYFIDTKSGALRVMDKNYRVETLIGKAVGEFGYKDGDKKEALFDKPAGIFANRNGIYISDSKNDKIRKYQYSNKKIKTIFGDKAGDSLGDRDETSFEEPDGLIVLNNAMFIVDSNNNRVVKIDFSNMKSSLIDILPPMKLPNEGFLEYLPNLERLAMAEIKSDTDIPLDVSFDKGWKLNEYGPSFLNLLEIVGDRKANLVATYDWNMIKNNIAILPKLKIGKKYIIQGTVYYCEDKRNALCYISSYEQELTPLKNGRKILNIDI